MTAEINLNIIFPEEYKFFLRKSNGAEGPIGENSYLVLWSVGELEELNKAYQADVHSSALLIFGSDGGGEAFAFNLENDNKGILTVPFVSLRRKDAENVGQSFFDLFEYLIKL